MTFIFEYCPITLASRIGSGLTECQAHKFMGDIIEGIKAVYRHGFIHRDIKPENILLKRDDDGTEYALLTDFGFAVSLERCESTLCAGTPGYLAPECGKSPREGKHSSLKMDIYSLGITLIRMLSPEASEKKDFSFVTLQHKMRTYVTNSCWYFIQQMTMNDPAKRIGYEELFEHPWLKAKASDLKCEYYTDRVKCLDEACKVFEIPEGEVKRTRELLDLYCKWNWPEKGENPEESRNALSRKKTYSAVIPKKVFLKCAKLFAAEGSECENLFPTRAINEYKLAIIYLSISKIYLPHTNPTIAEAIDPFIEAVSARISKLDDLLLGA